MHKVNIGFVPTYIAELIPPLVGEFRDTHSEIFFSTLFTRTNVSTRSCLPSAIRMWNNLDESLKSKQTISSFKHNLRTTTLKKYKYLATSHLEKDICLYYMLELETTVVIKMMIYLITIFVIIPFVVGTI